MALNKNERVAVGVGIVVFALFLFFFTNIFSLSKGSQSTSQPQPTTKPIPMTATKGSLVTVNYTGKFQDGTVFDTSVGRQPFTFVLGMGEVIPGWDEGLMGMKPGDKKQLIVPPEKGYGAQGYPPVIPANATLIFDVEMVDVQTQ